LRYVKIVKLLKEVFMKNRFCLSFAAALTLISTLSAAPSSDAVKFRETVSKVDMDGEMLCYQNTKGIQKLLTGFIPQLLKHTLKDNPMAPTLIQGWDSFCQLINPGAFEAFAVSSREISSDLYIAKGFILLDRQKKSILFEQKVENTTLDWQKFPADTIAAVKGRINLKHTWDSILEQLKNSPDKGGQSLLMQIEMLKQAGVDIGGTISGIDGELELIVAGTSAEDLAVKFVIPDKSGVLSALLIPLIQDLPLPSEGLQLKNAIVPGKIVFYTDKRLLEPAKNTLGSSATFKKFAAHLPEKGNLTVALNVSGKLLEQIKKANAADNPELSEFCTLLEPFALLGIQSSEANGEKAVIASNFSISQVQQISSLLMPAAMKLIPALDSAREKSKLNQCMNGMKQFALACHLFADGANDTLPDSVDKFIEQRLLRTEISANIIYLAPGIKLSEITIPAQYPLAICDRFNHKSGKVCIAFADGHVETLDVPADADEEDIVEILGKMYKYPQPVLDALKKAVSEEEK